MNYSLTPSSKKHSTAVVVQGKEDEIVTEEKGESISEMRKSLAPATARKDGCSTREIAPLMLVVETGSLPFPPLMFFEEEGLVRIFDLGEKEANGAPVPPYAVVERTDACACTARDGLAVRDRNFWVCRDSVSHVGHGAFRFPFYEENAGGRGSTTPSNPATDADAAFRTALAWLLTSHFGWCTFRTRIVKGHGLERILKDARDVLFRQVTPLTTCDCLFYQMDEKVDFVYFLKNIVFSEKNKKGPTIESVLF